MIACLGSGRDDSELSLVYFPVPCPSRLHNSATSHTTTMSMFTSLPVGHDLSLPDSPAEDSFILLDALEQDAEAIRSLRPSLSLEIG